MGFWYHLNHVLQPTWEENQYTCSYCKIPFIYVVVIGFSYLELDLAICVVDKENFVFTFLSADVKYAA